MKVRTAFKLILLTFFCLLLSAEAGLGTTVGTVIRVFVKNEHDKPVENAAIVLDFLGSHSITRLGMRKPIHWEVHTNQEGKAHFPRVPEGTVQLQVITKAYQTYGQKIDIDGDEKLVEITLKPPQAQYSAHPPLKPKEEPKDSPKQ